ncbi:MAG: tetratricopeptide repeat protein [Chloroflexi bacterium]|nr:tetratricopeptide repeat protein [Chloroflexota bacterium]
MKKAITFLMMAAILFNTGCSLVSKLGKSTTTSDENAAIDESPVILEAAPTNTPTSTPEIRLDIADAYLFAGDLENALLEYNSAFQQSTDDEEKALALYGMGRVYMKQRDYPSAIDALTHILGQFANTAMVANAYYLLGECYSIQEDYQQAANSYAQFLALKPGIIDTHVLLLQAAASSNAGDHYGAIYALQKSVQAEPAAGSTEVNLKIGKEYAALQDYTTAIQYYLSAYNTASNDYQRATADLLAGQAYLELGLTDQAYTQFLDAVLKYPMAYDSFTSLSILVNANYPVDEYMRGLVDYYAGSYYYAIQAFNRYLDSDPVNDGSVYYFRGLSYYYNGDYLLAIQDYQTLIDNYPDNRFWDAAWEEIAFVYWNTPGDAYADISDYQSSVQTRLDFVEQAPQSSYAPYFLYLAGRTLEYNDELEQAAQIWARMINEYPTYEYSYHALFLTGISYYRLGRYEDALNTFQRCLGLSAVSDEKASSYLWLGKTYQQMGKQDEARNAWQQAEASDPTDYYGIRAGDLLNGKYSTDIDAVYEMGYDLDAERVEAENWMRTTFNISTETSLTGLGDMSNDSKILRGTQYWELGLYELASSEFEAIRVEQTGNPINSYLLMNYLYGLGFYKPAILACRDILTMAGMDDLSSLSAPIYFTHIRFGAYFRNLVVSAANDQGIHPLILFSLLRQESLFEPFASSAAGAQGIAQIIPSTGKDIVDRYGWPSNYTTQDLLLAKVGITLGARYLRQQLDYLGGDILAALAAYNGGPGNAYEWKVLSNGDPDLFVEVVRYDETRTYLKQIIEFLNIYKLVYTRIS